MLHFDDAPFPVKYRELWVPELSNNNSTLPSCRNSGHALSVSGARLASTSEGVHIDSTATSNINLGAIHNAATELWVSLKFKLDNDYSSAVSYSTYIFGKKSGAVDFIVCWLSPGTGKLYVEKRTGGVNDFQISTTETSWNAGQWYRMLFSVSSTNGARLRIDNGTAVTDADTSAITNGGDLIIGDQSDPGGGTGFRGVISDVVMGTDDLTTDEETNLYRGSPPADAVNLYTLDEGRGVTAHDRGSGGNDGTLDSSCTWSWEICRQPVLSFDGINDKLTTGALCSIDMPFTLVWVGKVCSSVSTPVHYLLSYYKDGSNYIYIQVYGGNLVCRIVGPEGGSSVLYAGYTLNDYTIVMLTVDADGVFSAYVDGKLKSSASNAKHVPNLTKAGLGCWAGSSYFDNSKHMFNALLDDSLSSNQVKTYSQWLNDLFKLGIDL